MFTIHGEPDNEDTKKVISLLKQAGLRYEVQGFGSGVDPDLDPKDVLDGKGFRVCPTLVSERYGIHGGLEAIRCLVKHVTSE